MKMFKIIILILLYQSSAAQETIIKSNYSIRDFFKKDNEITYIEKRMVFTKTVNFRDEKHLKCSPSSQIFSLFSAIFLWISIFLDVLKSLNSARYEK